MQAAAAAELPPGITGVSPSAPPSDSAEAFQLACRTGDRLVFDELVKTKTAGACDAHACANRAAAIALPVPI